MDINASTAPNVFVWILQIVFRCKFGIAVIKRPAVTGFTEIRDRRDDRFDALDFFWRDRCLFGVRFGACLKEYFGEDSSSFRFKDLLSVIIGGHWHPEIRGGMRGNVLY